MNHTGAQVKSVLTELVADMALGVKPEVVVAPVFPYLETAVQLTQGTAVHIAAQNMHFEESGAYTGEVSPSMLVDIGVEYVIIGHSERRTYFNETDETVNLKVKAALAHDLIPIMCCGETLQQREQGEMQRFIEGQIEAGLDGISKEEVENIVIAYEPIWAIGTGKTATVEQAQEVCALIRRKLEALYDIKTADKISILYGGSVKSGNVGELTSSLDIDGGLVGGGSLKADEFTKIITTAVVK